MRLSARKQLRSRVYIEKPDLPNGLTPINFVLIESMVYLMQPHWAESEHRSKESTAFLLANLLQEYLLFSNVCTIKTQIIKNKMLRLYADFMKPLQTQKD